MTFHEQLTLLCAEFNVPPVHLTLYRQREGERYTAGVFSSRPFQRIRLRVGSDTLYAQSVLVHEFAHYLRHLRSPLKRPMPTANSRMYGRAPRRTPHDAVFCETLVQVATAWYGKPERYPWDLEYKTVRAWAAQQDLTTPPPLRNTPIPGLARGAVVAFVAKGGRTITGTVKNAKAGCRVRVAGADAREYLVPTKLLQIIMA
jgi:hypothetical protein